MNRKKTQQKTIQNENKVPRKLIVAYFRSHIRLKACIPCIALCRRRRRCKNDHQVSGKFVWAVSIVIIRMTTTLAVAAKAA